MASRPQLLLARSLADAQAILAGPAIQVRCLECSSGARPLRAQERASLQSWLGWLIQRR
jgi:protease-4